MSRQKGGIVAEAPRTPPICLVERVDERLVDLCVVGHASIAESLDDAEQTQLAVDVLVLRRLVEGRYDRVLGRVFADDFL